MLNLWWNLLSHLGSKICLLCIANSDKQDFLSDVSICKWGFSENDVATGERPHDVSAFPGGWILTFLKYQVVLCVWPRLYMNRNPSASTNEAITCLQCASQHLRPESPLTDKWQQRVSCCFTPSTQTTHPLKSKTKSQRNKLTSAVNITLLSTTAVSHFTSAACKTVGVTNDSKGLMPLHTCVCRLVSPLSPHFLVT